MIKQLTRTANERENVVCSSREAKPNSRTGRRECKCDLLRDIGRV